MRKALNLLLNYLPVIAIIAVGYFLFNLEFNFKSFELKLVYLMFSFLPLFFCYFFLGFSWFVYLSSNNIFVSQKTAIASQFKTVLTKYIPGKVWMVLSAAHYIGARSGVSLKKTSYLFMVFLMINVLAGLLLGGFGMLLYLQSKIPTWIVLIYMLAIILGLFFFSGRIKLQFLSQKKRMPQILQKIIDNPVRSNLHVVLLACIQWLMMGIAFYFFILGLGFDINLSPVFLQPLANNIGMLVPIAPGGIGVRESIMSLYLALNNIDIHHAATIAIVSRIWFVCMEIFVFGMGYLIENINPEKVITDVAR